MGRRHVLLGILVSSWMLLYSRHGQEWIPLDQFTSPGTCSRVRATRVSEEALREIGSTLASQPWDNPLRQRAVARAADRVEGRFRCSRP